MKMKKKMKYIDLKIDYNLYLIKWYKVNVKELFYLVDIVIKKENLIKVINFPL